MATAKKPSAKKTTTVAIEPPVVPAPAKPKKTTVNKTGAETTLSPNAPWPFPTYSKP